MVYIHTYVYIRRKRIGWMNILVERNGISSPQETILVYKGDKKERLIVYWCDDEITRILVKENRIFGAQESVLLNKQISFSSTKIHLVYLLLSWFNRFFCVYIYINNIHRHRCVRIQLAQRNFPSRSFYIARFCTHCSSIRMWKIVRFFDRNSTKGARSACLRYNRVIINDFDDNYDDDIYKIVANYIYHWVRRSPRLLDGCNLNRLIV